MRYLDTRLQPGEPVLYRTRQHWGLFSKPLLLILATMVVADFDDGRYAYAASLVFVFFAIPYSIATLVAYLVSDVVVTDRRFIARLGLRRVSVTETVLHKIEESRVEPALVGRLLGYGTLTMRSAGGARRRIPHLRNAVQFAETLEHQRTRLHDETA